MILYRSGHRFAILYLRSGICTIRRNFGSTCYGLVHATGRHGRNSPIRKQVSAVLCPLLDAYTHFRLRAKEKRCLVCGTEQCLWRVLIWHLPVPLLFDAKINEADENTPTHCRRCVLLATRTTQI